MTANITAAAAGPAANPRSSKAGNGNGKERANPQHEEYQYLDLISRIISTGQSRPDRTGTGTVALFAPPSLRFSLANSTLPLLTTKRVFLRGVIAELLWFIKGSTDAKLLSDQGVNIWDGNGSKAFLEKVGLGHRREGDLGPVYGFQWRHFGAEYGDADGDYEGKGVDQLKEVCWKIVNNPTDRRIILSAWNPKDLPLMALPPCHMFCQFYVTLPDPSTPSAKPKLSCLMYQRSCDLGLGIPFNIASYSLLTHMIAYITDTEPHEFILQMGDAHVYKDHIEPLKTQLEREPRDFPSLRFKRSKDEVGDIDGFTVDDFEVEGYKPWGKIEMKMSLKTQA
ncbi:thymidylate synthase [Kwoniella heveanensis CBS 569]|nr:thymidylate synthase [Kwoniella heveanensis CBS 569]